MPIFKKQETVRYTPDSRDPYGQFTDDLVLRGSTIEIVIKKKNMEEIPLDITEARFVVAALRDWLEE